MKSVAFGNFLIRNKMKDQRSLVCLFLFATIVALSGQFVSGNVVYRFGFDFGIGLARTTFNGTFNITEGKTNDEPEHSMPEIHPTSAPGLDTLWSQQAHLNAVANERLQTAVDTVTQLKSDLLPLESQSSFIASKIKLMSEYLNKVHMSLNNDNSAENHFKLLQDFVQLVDDLRAQPSGNEQIAMSPLEYTTMKLALDKHKMNELQSQILLETLQAVETWQEYTKTQMLDLVSV